MSIALWIALQAGCRVNSEQHTTNALSKPNEPALARSGEDAAGASLVPSGTGTGRPRPAGNEGRVTLEWSGVRELADWSAQLQIYEGADGADHAELAMSATGDDGVRFSFSAQYRQVTPASMRGLLRQYTLASTERDNLLLLETPGEQPNPARGWLRIVGLDGGILSGAFDGVIEDARGPQPVKGEFRGPLGVSCNVLAKPTNGTVSGSAVSQAGASWTNVAANHPFCARYL